MAPPNPALKLLSFRNYRIFFTGQAISLTGTWMQQIAMGWLVYRLTGSALALGALGFVANIPSFFLSPFAGVLVDRWNLRRLIMLTQAIAMAQAFLLWALVVTGKVQVWQLYPLSLLLGVVNAFDIPGRQSFVVQVIEDRALLGNAIALNSSLFNTARLVGPALAGYVIAAHGESVCFMANALSYLGALGALSALRLKPHVPRVHQAKVWHEIREGVRYISGFPTVRYILLLLTVISLAGMPYAVLLPIFAKEVLQGGAGHFGLLTAAGGVGALSAALYLAHRQGVQGLLKFIPYGFLLMGASLAAFAVSNSLWLSLPLLVLVGGGNMIGIAVANTLLQTMVDDDKRGRVMGFWSLSMVGFGPLGSLLYGFLASYVGAPYTLVIGGGLTMLAALAFLGNMKNFKVP